MMFPMFEQYHGFTLPEARQEIKEQAEAVFVTVGSLYFKS